MKIKPICDYVLIRRLDSEKGQLIKPVVKKGDKVLFTKWSGTDVKLTDESLVVMKESDIIAIIED